MRAQLPLMPWPWPWPRRMTTIWPAHEGWECINCAERNAFHYWQLCSHCGQCKPWWEWPAPPHVQWMAPHNVVEAPQRLSPERQEWLARENVAGGVIWQRPSPAHATESSASGGGGQAPPASGGGGEAPRDNPWADPVEDIHGLPMRWGSAPEGIRADPDATYRLIDYLPELAAKQMSCTEGLAYHQVRLPKLHEDLQYCMLQVLSLALLNQVIEWACGQGHRHTTLPHALAEAEGRALITHADARWIRHINRMGNRAKHEPAHSARSRSPHSRGWRR